MRGTEVDRALLVALKALLQVRNVTHAASQLGITQSALSGRLARLREIFADPLFVPAGNGRGVVPTPRAEALEEELLDLLERLQRLVDAPAEFDPATTQRTFVVGLFDTPAAVLAPELSARVRSAAPGAKLAFIHPPADAAERLEQGRPDLLVIGHDGLAGDLMQRPLWADGFRTAQRKGHPRGTAPLDLDTYCLLDHLVVSSQGGGFSTLIDKQLAGLGRRRNVVLSIQSYGLAPLLLARIDCVCTLPASFLAQYENQLDLLDPPLELADIRLSLVWHPRSNLDAGHIWLRKQMYLSAGLDAH